PGAPPLLYDADALARHGVDGVGSLAAVSISAGEELLGALAIWTVRTHAIGAREFELLSHAAQHLTAILATGQQAGGHVNDPRLPRLRTTPRWACWWRAARAGRRSARPITRCSPTWREPPAGWSPRTRPTRPSGRCAASPGCPCRAARCSPGCPRWSARR